MKYRTILKVLFLILVLTASFAYGIVVGRYRTFPYYVVQSGQDSVTRMLWGKASVEEGEKLFKNSCARCHGFDGSGGEGPSLNRPDLRIGGDDEALRLIIRQGIPSAGMPGMDASQRDTDQIIAYVRELGKRVPSLPSGNAGRGGALYNKFECGSCHIIQGQGNGFGPELTRVGSIRSIDYLRKSLTDPDSALPRGISPVTGEYSEYLPVRVVTNEGNEILGVRMNEDTFTIQLRDASGRLHSLRKSELRAFDKKPNTSLMPSYKDLLNESDLEDVVAYLSSLTGAQ